MYKLRRYNCVDCGAPVERMRNSNDSRICYECAVSRPADAARVVAMLMRDPELRRMLSEKAADGPPTDTESR